MDLWTTGLRSEQGYLPVTRLNVLGRGGWVKRKMHDKEPEAWSPLIVFDGKSKVGAVCANRVFHTHCGGKWHEDSSWSGGLEEEKTRKQKRRPGVQGNGWLTLELGN